MGNLRILFINCARGIVGNTHPRKLDTWTIYFYTETTREVLLFIETDTVCGS